MTQESDPKSYSLENLEMWVNDAIESECNSDEIINTNLETVKNNMRYHKACFNTSVRLYAKLNGNPEDVNLDREYTEREYWNGDVPEQEFERYLQKYGYEYTPEIDATRFKLDSSLLHNDDEEN